MPDFTQGKWLYTGHDIIAVNNGYTRDIACMYFHSKDGAQEAADARLIAAAPDMYSLLTRFTRCIKEDDMFDIMEEAQILLERIDGMEAHS